MIINRNLEERLYSTGYDELDELLEKAFCDGYEYAQREFGKLDLELAKKNLNLSNEYVEKNPDRAKKILRLKRAVDFNDKLKNNNDIHSKIYEKGLSRARCGGEGTIIPVGGHEGGSPFYRSSGGYLHSKSAARLRKGLLEELKR